MKYIFLLLIVVLFSPSCDPTDFNLHNSGDGPDAPSSYYVGINFGQTANVSSLYWLSKMPERLSIDSQNGDCAVFKTLDEYVEEIDGSITYFYILDGANSNVEVPDFDNSIFSSVEAYGKKFTKTGEKINFCSDCSNGIVNINGGSLFTHFGVNLNLQTIFDPPGSQNEFLYVPSPNIIETYCF